jgi:hypothetical protein
VRAALLIAAFALVSCGAKPADDNSNLVTVDNTRAWPLKPDEQKITGYWVRCRNGNPNCHEFVGSGAKSAFSTELRAKAVCPADGMILKYDEGSYFDRWRDEIGAYGYAQVTQLVRCKPDLKPQVAKAFADGIVTHGELNSLWSDESSRDTDRQKEHARAELKAALQ